MLVDFLSIFFVLSFVCFILLVVTGLIYMAIPETREAILRDWNRGIY